MRSSYPWAKIATTILVATLMGCGTLIDSDEQLRERVATTGGGGTSGGDDVSYTGAIAPFLATYCNDCHNAGNASGGIDTSMYHMLLDGGVVVPGDTDKSPLVRVLVEGTMPPAGIAAPTPPEIATVEAWIAAGAPEN